MFHSLKNCDAHLIMQELGKFDFKIHVIPNRLKKYRSFSLNNKLGFTDSFQFLSSSLISPKFRRNDFKHLSQELEVKMILSI